MFLTVKRDATIKARGCAERRSQREYVTKTGKQLIYIITRGNDVIMCHQC